MCVHMVTTYPSTMAAAESLMFVHGLASEPSWSPGHLSVDYGNSRLFS